MTLCIAVLLGVGIETLQARPRKKTPTRSELQKQKSAARAEIKQAQGRIRSNEREIASNLRRVQLLETQIDDTHHSLDSLAAENHRLAENGRQLQAEIDSNRRELDRMRADYLREIRQMRLHRVQTSGIAFLFAAKDFRQGLARMRYMRRIADWRRSRTEAIGGQIASLETRNRQFDATRRAQDATVAETYQRRESLSADKRQLEHLSDKLRSDNRGLQTLIARKRSEITSLDRQTAAMIAQAQARAEQQRLVEQKRREQQPKQAQTERQREQVSAQAADKPQPARTPPATASASASESPYAKARGRRPRSSAPEQKGSVNQAAPSSTSHTNHSSTSFASAKGALPNPVSGKFRIVIPYGRHSRPDMPKVQLDNTGIDAEVNAGAAVKAVYDGQVAAIYKAQGFGTVVLVRHGEYYTVYANLDSCNVSPGQKLHQGQQLGIVVGDGELAPTMHFEVWKQRTHLNPSEWLR